MAKSKSFLDETLDSAEEVIAEKQALEDDKEEEPQIDQEADSEPTEASKDEAQADVQPVVKQETAQPTPQPEPPTGIEAPQFWSPEHKAIFAKAPKEVQQAVLQYEQARNEWASRYAKEASSAKELNEKLSPYSEKLKGYDVQDPLQAALQSLEWSLEVDQNPMQGVLQLMADHQITLEQLYKTITSGQFEPQRSFQDPRIEEARNAALEAKKLAEEQANWIKTQQSNYQASEVNRFLESKDSMGNIRKEFARTYSPQISMAAEALQKQGVPLYQALEQAYESTLASARKLFGGAPSSAPQSAPKKVQTTSSSVSGAPINGVASKKPKPKTIDEALDMAEEQLGAH